MAYYTFTEIRSYNEGDTPQKDWKVEAFSDADKSELIATTEMTTCGSDIDNPEKIQAEVDGLTTNSESPSYDLRRKQAYPSIEEQLDMQYWDSVNGTTTWKDAIAKVKNDISKE